MGFYRLYPEKDTWITDAHPENSLTIRASGSNHGRSPVLNVFARKADINSGSIELARSLVQFSIPYLSGLIFSDRLIPSSSVTYVLKMCDMKHGDTLPASFDLFAYPVSRSWDEGNGIDDDELRDDGYANWLSASSVQGWTTGSDFVSTVSGSQHFDRGDEDLEMDVTSIVNEWLTGSMSNRRNGLVVKMGVEETNGTNYYRKAFHSRESKYVDRLPYLEARWSEVKKDNRKNFAFNQDSQLYLYNFVRGELVNLTEPVFIRLQDNILSQSASYRQEFTASRVETGVYSASFNIRNTASFSASWYDIWYSGSVAYMTGVFTPLVLTGSQIDPYGEFTLDITNLKRVYGVNEEARLIVNVRKRDWITHRGIVNSASLDIEREYIEKMYYSVENDETGEVIVPFGTGTIPYTQLSYNGDGNYFNLWMNSFVPGLKYRIKFLVDINKYDKKVIDDNFTFKVV